MPEYAFPNEMKPKNNPETWTDMIMLDLNTSRASLLKIYARADSFRSNDTDVDLVAAIRQSGQHYVTDGGVVFTETGKFTGRSANDKFIVDDEVTSQKVWWKNSNKTSKSSFDCLMQDMCNHTRGHEIFHQQLFAAANPDHQLGVEVISTSAWHSLFIRQMLIRPEQADLASFKQNVLVLHMPDFLADPKRHGTKSSVCIATDLKRNIILICGTAYAGEIKKAVFSLFNFHAPDQDVLPMHCSSNVGSKGDAAVFFGLSGTGKTTLSTTHNRALVGDDEHGWGEAGIFNLEGGCYAKALNLTETQEPQIFRAAHMFGTIMENVVRDKVTGQAVFKDASLAENSRIAYPITSVENRVQTGMAATPKHVVFLSADAFGVLPPIARLTHEQAIYFFLSGYTAKVAGTENGVVEPTATFSACFGAPFMTRHPQVYGELLRKRLAESNAKVWLINTGWTGGSYHSGHRISLKTTRLLLNSAISGQLDNACFQRISILNLDVPEHVDQVDDILLTPKETWANKHDYDFAAEKLEDMFKANFAALQQVTLERDMYETQDRVMNKRVG
jgi:phosphoenolpyruvate carboxykinase (ATP)